MQHTQNMAFLLIHYRDFIQARPSFKPFTEVDSSLTPVRSGSGGKLTIVN